jgi:hypothetical protein
MPTTFVGLIIFIAFLTPGFLYAAHRRMLAPQANRSPLMETTTIVSISFATNALVACAFGVLRAVVPDHTPNVGRLLETDSEYWSDKLPYVAAWALVLFSASCAVAVLVARWEWLRRRVAAVFTPVIVDSSAWCEVFSAEPGSYPHAGLELTDGGYVSGRVVWFSTETQETGDRDLVLGPPLQVRTGDGIDDLKVQRVVIAARNIARIDVTYIDGL